MLYLVRHGETLFNGERRQQGSLDLPLIDAGIMQAQRVGSRLASLVDASWPIHCSPLQRARQTAEIVAAQLGSNTQSIIVDNRLREVDLGDWQGLTRPEIEERWPHVAPL